MVQRPRSLCCVVCPVRTKATWSPDQGSVRPSGATADAPLSLLSCSCEVNSGRSRCLGRGWRSTGRNGHDPTRDRLRGSEGVQRVAERRERLASSCIARYSSSHSPSIHSSPHMFALAILPAFALASAAFATPVPLQPEAATVLPFGFRDIACVSRLLAPLHGLFLLADQALQRAFALPVLQLLRRHQSPVQGGQAVLGQALPAGLRLVCTS